MTPRSLILAGAILLGIVAAVLFMTPVSAVTPGGADVSCGTVWKPDDKAGMYGQFQESMTSAFQGRYNASTGYDGYKAACSDARDGRGTWGYVLAGLCVFGLLGGAAVRRSTATGQRTA